jgi:hypothetical protein
VQSAPTGGLVTVGSDVKRQMGPALKAGVSIVVLALPSDTAGVIAEPRSGRVTRRALAFQDLGVALAVTATVCMIIGSGKLLTLEGVLGSLPLVGVLLEPPHAARRDPRVAAAQPAARSDAARRPISTAKLVPRSHG